MQMVDSTYSAQFQELFFWLSKQICHPIRKVLERNVRPCKGNNNQHMPSYCTKILESMNAHHAHNYPQVVTVLQNEETCVYKYRGFPVDVKTPPLDLRILTLGRKLDKSTSEAHCNSQIPLFYTAVFLLVFLHCSIWRKKRTLGISQSCSSPRIPIVHFLQLSVKDA